MILFFASWRCRGRPAIERTALNTTAAPNIVPEGAAAADDAMDVEENDDDDIAFEFEDAVPEGVAPNGENPQKCRRVSRIITAAIFVDMEPGSTNVYCRLGCISDDGVQKKRFAAPNNGHITRHVKEKHPLLWTMFEDLKRNTGNLNTLLTSIKNLNDAAEKKVTKAAKSKLYFMKLVAPGTGVPEKAQTDLVLLCWSIANVVGRLALNCPIFDFFLKKIGSIPAPNRHTLADVYLPQLDSLVRSVVQDALTTVQSVSLSCDGWRSNNRGDFINITMQYTAPKGAGWAIVVQHLDLVYLPGRSTGEHLSSIISDSANSFVRSCYFSALSVIDSLLASREVSRCHDDHRWRRERAQRCRACCWRRRYFSLRVSQCGAVY